LETHACVGVRTLSTRTQEKSTVKTETDETLDDSLRFAATNTAIAKLKKR